MNPIKKWQTLILKIAVVVAGVIALAFYIFALPNAWTGGPAEFPEASRAIQLIIVGLYGTAIPFFIALWHIFELLLLVDKNQAFSETSVATLRTIKLSVLAIGILYMGGVPLLFPIAQADDAPGLIIFGFIIACVPLAVATFVHVLEKLLKGAVDTRSGQ